VSSPDFDVIVVGAGIAGSALLRSLQGSGLRLALVEANPIATGLPEITDGTAGFDSRVSAITPASEKLLDGLGVWEQVRASRVCPYQHMKVWDAQGTGAIDFDAAELDVPALGHIVENRLLNAALLQGMEEQGNQVTLFNPARLQELRRNQAQHPILQLEDGREITCRLLVAADGALSRIRELANFRTREWDYGHQALVATVQTENFHNATAYQRFLDTGPLALLPLASQGDNHFCSIVWSCEPELASQLLSLNEEQFCAELALATEQRLGNMLSASSRFSFPLRQRHAVDYVQAGIALVGDAAHTIHPLAGQGINLGLQDVQVLAEEILSASARGVAPGELVVLQRFQRRRKSENLMMMTAMDGFKRLFGQRQLPVRWLRNTGMRLVDKSGPLKIQLMRHAMGIR
jgi:2-octaprenylphenol hydroxylase